MTQAATPTGDRPRVGPGPRGRSCRVCGPRSAMRAQRRHLHELQPGDRWRHTPDGRVHVLLSNGPTRCHTATPGGRQERMVRFTTDDGATVEFTKAVANVGTCSPTAEVLPV